MKSNLIFLLLLVSGSLKAECLLVDTSYKGIPLKKIIVKEANNEGDPKNPKEKKDVWTYIKIEVEGKVYGGDGFSCSPKDLPKNAGGNVQQKCYGNDESGFVLINKTSIKVNSLKIRLNDRDFYTYKGSQEWIPYQRTSCSKYFK